MARERKVSSTLVWQGKATRWPSGLRLQVDVQSSRVKFNAPNSVPQNLSVRFQICEAAFKPFGILQRPLCESQHVKSLCHKVLVYIYRLLVLGLVVPSGKARLKFM